MAGKRRDRRRGTGLTGAFRTTTIQENLAARFRRETQSLFRTRLLTAAMFGALLMPLFGVVDYLAAASWAPDLPLALFLATRAVVSLWFVLLWAVLRRKRGFNVAAMDWLLFAPPAVALGWMSAMSGGASSPYAAGTMLLVTARTILVPGEARAHLPVVGFIVASYPLSLVLFGPGPAGLPDWLANDVEMGYLASNLFPLLSMAGIGLVASDMIHAMHQRMVSARSLGRYKIKKELGRGAMGVVYLAWHRDLGRPCVVKVVSPEHGGAAIVRRFEREARETSLLASPYTVDVFDFGVTQDGRLFYVMEYLDGMTLQEVLDVGGAQPYELVCRWLLYVCEALAEAHHRGLIHRDLKPANLFLARTADGRQIIKVLDFGIARKTEEDDHAHLLKRKKKITAEGIRSAELTAVGMVMGTPLYVAPEVLRGARATAASDQYSLAATAFHLLTGRPVFEADSIEQLLFRTVEDPPPHPSHVVDGSIEIPPELDAVLMQALCKNPQDRFESMEAFRQALQPLATLPAGAVTDLSNSGMRWEDMKDLFEKHRRSAGTGEYPPEAAATDPGERAASERRPLP